MDAIEIAETVKAALLKQGKRSVAYEDEHNSSCMYRGVNGLKCAIGHLIKDEQYDECMEHTNVLDSAVSYALESNGICLTNYPTRELLVRLQTIHDTEAIEDWPRLFDAEIAKLKPKETT